MKIRLLCTSVFVNTVDVKLINLPGRRNIQCTTLCTLSFSPLFNKSLLQEHSANVPHKIFIFTCKIQIILAEV